METISSAEVEESSSDLFCAVEADSDASVRPLPSSLDVGSDLARSYLDSALNPVTVRQYKGALQRWETFCAQNGLPLTPAEPAHVAACLALTASESQSVSAVEKLVAAIAFEHRRQFLPSPTSHESISLLLRSIRRHLTVERQPKQPLTHEILRRMADHLQMPEHGRDGLLASIVLWRTVWRAHMEFYTLGRFSDIVRLHRNDVVILDEPKPHLVVKFLGGKTDIFSEGSNRIVCSHDPTDRYCPVRLTELYFLRLGLTYSGYLMPRSQLRDGLLVPDPDRALSYTTSLEDLRNLLSLLGYDSTKFGEHSGKRGGATAAASAGLSAASLQRLGQWRSPRMPTIYTDLDASERLRLASFLNKK